MEVERAQRVVDIWGKHLEHCYGKLNMIFMAKIPESFLPFPKDVIEEATNIVAKHWFDVGNKEASTKIQSTISFLGFYEEDEKALLNAAKNFNDKKFRDAILPAFKKLQSEWLYSQKL